MKHGWIGCSLMVASASIASASPGPPPSGYTLVSASASVPDSVLSGISQLAFMPGDAAHLFAVRSSAGAIERFDYSSSGMLTNPIAVVLT